MSTLESTKTPANPQLGDPQNTQRAFYLILLTVVLSIIFILCFLYWFVIDRFYEETDNAYVNGNIIPITAQVDGIVIAIEADSTQFVKAEQPLVQLDPIDSFIAFEQAKADLASTVRKTHQFFLNNSGLNASIVAHEASLERADQDLKRRANSIDYGAVSKEELTHAQNTFKNEEAVLAQARSALLANKALTDNTNLENHPSVLSAIAKLKKAYITYLRTTLRAPIAGEVAKRTVQVGQRITTGTVVMTIVPLDEVWVDANFKEKQLRTMRIGQPVTLTADLYGSSVKYHGTIFGFSAGTGSAFALLPAQNATGNWIKVVQRLPVRIQLDPQELQAHPLRIGLSMEVTVDTHNRQGQFISTNKKPTVYKTTIYSDLNQESNSEIKKIMIENISKTVNLNDVQEAPEENTGLTHHTIKSTP